ncbi:MAG: ATP-dependent DNA helicase RecG [Deltaproteobacteria bacterium]|nr:ATP-dependent DNA helicase RecG [Deltaproteobacteria bacterium]
MTPSYRVNPIKPADCREALQLPLSVLKGIGPVRAAQLAARGLATIEDLLYHLPFRYEDRRGAAAVRDAVAGEGGAFVGRLTSLRAGRLRGRRRILTGTLTDDTGSLELVWFNPPRYLTDTLRVGQRLSVYGRVAGERGGRLSLPHPEFEVLEGDAEREPEVRPIYAKPGDVPQSSLRGWIAQALERFGGFLPSFLPSEVALRQKLVDLEQALETLHRPSLAPTPALTDEAGILAHRSLAFDEFFYFQLALALRQRQRLDTPGFSFPARAGSLTDRMRNLLPYRLTGGQERVLREIHADMESPSPMRRLLQGDVGSGKTVIAWLAALRTIENGRQALLLAPTELLAEQHHERLRPYAERLRVRAALLSGSLRPGARKDIIQRIRSGAVDFVVGTHALFQEGVRVPRMGLGIVDEQHRFGVSQRTAFARLAARDDANDAAPELDLLLMSATPIPRSLAMVLSGDLEVSLLDEPPPGRTPVRTVVVQGARRQQVYERVRAAVADGRQAYLVYPLVEDSDKIPLAAAERMARELSGTVMHGLRLGLVHGQMPAAERDQVMRRFRQGGIQVLVATSVIEVGIDVPGATLMVVEHAERFGLAQLHQLRGRVGRGRDESYCVLIHYGARDDDARQRLEVLERHTDGFEVAEADLRFRGAGEILGTRQAGSQGFRTAHLVRDHEVLQEARREARDWLTRNPRRESDVSRRVRRELRRRWGNAMELGAWAD